MSLTKVTTTMIRDSVWLNASDFGWMPNNVTPYAAADISAKLTELASDGIGLQFSDGIYTLDTTLIMSNATRLRGVGDGYADNALGYTKFVCADAAATAVIKIYNVGLNYIEVYIENVWLNFSATFSHATYAANIRAGLHIETQLTNAFLSNIHVSECKYGYYTERGFWSSTIGPLNASLCYTAFYSSGAGAYITSVDMADLRMFQCFNGAYINSITYSSMSGYVDACGENCPARFQIATEAPVALMFIVAKGLLIKAFGAEVSSMMMVYASGFSTVNIAAMRLDQDINSFWRYDAAKALPFGQSVKQALFMASNSAILVSSISTTLAGSVPTANDLFAATTSNTSSITFNGCFIDAPAYCFDWPPALINTGAAFYSNNIRALNTTTFVAALATSDFQYVYVNENGVGAEYYTRDIRQDNSHHYYLQKQSAGTDMSFNINVTATTYWSGSLRMRFQPSLSGGAGNIDRQTAGFEEIIVEIRGGATITATTIKQSTNVAITASISGGNKMVIGSLLNNFPYDVYVEETVHRDVQSLFPISLISS